MAKALSRCLAAAILLTCTAPMASALEFETLFEQGDWRVDVNLWPDGSMDCEALTWNGDGDSFSIYETASGATRISFRSSRWDFPDEPTPTDFVVTVDSASPWQMSGSRSLSAISVTSPAGSPETSRFLREIGNGAQLHLANADGRHLLSFSLTGSAASLSALGTCAELLPDEDADDADPFRNSRSTSPSDPFR